MNHFTASRFWQLYEELPAKVQTRADRSFEFLKSDPQHPSLHFKKVGRYWSARVGRSYRALAVEDGEDLVWFWIGHHDDYDRLIEG